MIKLVDSDFKPLEDSAYLWRWTKPEYHVLPHSNIAQLRPLKAEKAQALWEYASVYLQELWRYVFADTSHSPISSLFVELQHIDISHQPPEKRQKHLATLEPHGDQVVVVMWEPTEAVAVSWHVLCSYWDDFLYPSDDAGILPLSETWLLLYHHEDQLVIGKPCLPLLDQDARLRVQNSLVRPLAHLDEVRRLLKANEKIAAIKLYHQETGVGLKQAMDVVNTLLANIGNDNT